MKVTNADYKDKSPMACFTGDELLVLLMVLSPEERALTIRFDYPYDGTLHDYNVGLSVETYRGEKELVFFIGEW